jgi:hypothetical protein
MSTLSAADIAILLVALDRLSRHTDRELTVARQTGNRTKARLMVALRLQTFVTSVKLRTMKVRP